MRSLHLVRLMGSLSVALAGALSACAGPELGDGPEGEDGGSSGGTDSPSATSLREQLAGATPFTVADGAGGSRANVTAVALSDGETALVEMSIVGGVVTLSMDGDDQVRFHELLVDSEDVTVSPAVVPPDGLHLTDLTVELTEPASVQLGSTTEEAVAAGAPLSVDVKWAVEVEHGVVELAPIRLPELVFDLSVQTDEQGELEAHLTASHPGKFWSWAGIFELRDLEIELVAAADR